MSFASFNIHAVKSIDIKVKRAVTESGHDVVWTSMVIKGISPGEDVEITVFHAAADVEKFERLAAAAREIFAEPAPAREFSEQAAGPTGKTKEPSTFAILERSRDEHLAWCKRWINSFN